MSKKTSKKIQAVVTNENYQQLEAIASSQGMKLHDFVRDALRRRCAELGFEIDLNVDPWGGKRQGAGKKTKTDGVPGLSENS